MEWSRRNFLGTVAAAAGAVAGPWSLAGKKGSAATADTPALSFLTPGEYRFINSMAREVVPDEPVFSGRVDVAANIDRFFALENTSPDFLIMFRFLRLIRLASGVLPILKSVAPATHEDIISFKRTICFLGYYSDLNGEADVDPAERVVWPRIGYGGPKSDDWLPPDAEDRLDQSKMIDRIEEQGS